MSRLFVSPVSACRVYDRQCPLERRGYVPVFAGKPVKHKVDGFSVGDVISNRAKVFPQSLIGEIARKAKQLGAINLGQGAPDDTVAEVVKQATLKAADAREYDLYADTRGLAELREAVAAKYSKRLKQPVDAENEVTITVGASEALSTAIDALVNPGDEVVLFSPGYNQYAPVIRAAGGVPRFVALTPPKWTFDQAALKAVLNPKTKALILNTPNNPTGKVFTAKELNAIATALTQTNAVVVTDEIYEDFVFDRKRHRSIAALPGMKERAIVVSGLSKSYMATGWRVGYVIAPKPLTQAIRNIHEHRVVSVPGLFQKAGVSALQLPDSYSRALVKDYQGKRDFMLKALKQAGFKPTKPAGGFFIYADAGTLCKRLGFKTDKAFCDWLLKEYRVAVIPGSNFVSGKQQSLFVRVSFCKEWDALKEAAKRLEALKLE